MIHGFDDSNKEKIEVYSKDDFVIITGTATVPASASYGIAISSSSLLNNYGIDDLSKYVPITINQTRATYEDWISPNIVNGSHVYPYVVLGSTLQIQLYNTGTSSRDIPYRVVLMKVIE